MTDQRTKLKVLAAILAKLPDVLDGGSIAPIFKDAAVQWCRNERATIEQQIVLAWVAGAPVGPQYKDVLRVWLQALRQVAVALGEDPTLFDDCERIVKARTRIDSSDERLAVFMLLTELLARREVQQ